jgi:uncharacterized membrane protein YdjX (TVP38/TMEM64 family)
MTLRKWLLFILVLAAVVAVPLAVRSPAGRAVLLNLLERIEQFGAGGLLLIALLYVPVCLLLLPGSLFTLAAGWLAGVLWPDSLPLALAAGTAAISCGSVAGATAAFLLGRTLLRERMAALLKQRPKLQTLDELVARNGFKMVFLLRLSPLFPFNLMNYALGLTQVRTRDYILGSWLGMLPGTVLFVYAGTTLSTLTLIATGDMAPPSAMRVAFVVVGLIATFALVSWFTVLAHRALSTPPDSPEQDRP